VSRMAKRREKHIMQMDNTKRMYIDQILRKTTFCDDFDYFSEVVGIGPDGQVEQANLTKEQLQQKSLQNKQKLRNSQAEVYFTRL
jgi:hypothetical protein